MAIRVRLSAEHIDDIARIIRAGVGLAMLGVGWNLIRVYGLGDFSSDTVLAALGFTGKLKEFAAAYLLGGPVGEYVTPVLLLKGAMGLVLATAVFIFVGYLLRFFGTLFFMIYSIPWFVGLVETVPIVFHLSDLPTLEGSVTSARQMAMAMMFLVLANIGAGSHSLDFRFHLPWLLPKTLSWDAIAVQIRFGLAFLFLGAGVGELAFGVVTYTAHPYLSLAVGIMTFFGLAPRFSGTLVLADIGWLLWTNLSAVKTFGPALEVFLPQAPFIAAAVIFLMAGGGERLKPHIKLTRTMWGRVD